MIYPIAIEASRGKGTLLWLELNPVSLQFILSLLFFPIPEKKRAEDSQNLAHLHALSKLDVDLTTALSLQYPVPPKEEIRVMAPAPKEEIRVKAPSSSVNPSAAKSMPTQVSTSF